jgi:hypothetical protein
MTIVIVIVQLRTIAILNHLGREHPNFAKIKFVVGASCSLMQMLRAREPSLQKINLHIWDAPLGNRIYLKKTDVALTIYIQRFPLLCNTVFLLAPLLA